MPPWHNLVLRRTGKLEPVPNSWKNGYFPRNPVSFGIQKKSAHKLPTWHNLVLRGTGNPVPFGVSRFKSGRRRRIRRIFLSPKTNWFWAYPGSSLKFLWNFWELTNALAFESNPGGGVCFQRKVYIHTISV